MSDRDSGTPDGALLAKEERAIFAASLLKLDEEKRQVFILNRFEGYSYATIAEMLNLTIDKVKYRGSSAFVELCKLCGEASDESKERVMHNHREITPNTADTDTASIPFRPHIDNHLSLRKEKTQ